MLFRNMTVRVLAAAFALMIGAAAANAQPSDAQVRKDMADPQLVNLKLEKAAPSTWDRSYSKWVWKKFYTAKYKTEEPGVNVIVTGYAAYEVSGGKYKFWRTFTSGSQYEGIPNPTAADLNAMVAKWGKKAFMIPYWAGQAIGEPESVAFSADPKFEWHRLTSMSFNVDVSYNSKEKKERGVHTFRVRLYRDNPKQEWQKVMPTDTLEWKKL